MSREEEALKIAERLDSMSPTEILEKIYLCRREMPSNGKVLDILVSAYRRQCEVILRRILEGAVSDE